MLNTALTHNEVSIHVGGPWDVNVFLAIERAAFSSDRISRAEYERLSESPDHVILFARYYRSAAGALFIKRDSDVSEAYLYSLAVIPEFRRLGIGKVLLTAGLALAAKWEVSKVVLEVRPDNSAAIRFYEHSGFVVTGSKANWYEDGSSALCMTRVVRNAPATSIYARRARI